MAQVPNGLTRELAERVLKQGELRLSAQLQLALAADQRAVTSAAILVAVASAAMGFAGEQASDTNTDVPFAVALLIAGVSLLVSAGFCVRVAWPVKFALAGAVPENWWTDGVAAKPLEVCLLKESNNYSGRINDNRVIINRNAALLRKGMYLACASPVIGLVSWSAFRLCL